jgi:hypothetical protein
VTVQDLITAALKNIGVVAKTEAPSPDESIDALARMVDLLDSWAVERLTIFNVVRTAFPLVSGQQVYTIGAGGNFNVPRPIWIQDAGIITTTGGGLPAELPMKLLSDDDWASITVKGVAAALSWYLYYDYAYPLGNISVWPIPNVSTEQVALYLPTPLSSTLALNTVLSLPPGYAEAIRFNLAVRLCPEFGRQVDPVIAAMAIESFARIERANKRLITLETDAALLVGSGQDAFNWITGSSGYRG